jgi:hypothetical protein
MVRGEKTSHPLPCTCIYKALFQAHICPPLLSRRRLENKRKIKHAALSSRTFHAETSLF